MIEDHTRAPDGSCVECTAALTAQGPDQLGAPPNSWCKHDRLESEPWDDTHRCLSCGTKLRRDQLPEWARGKTFNGRYFK